MHALALFLLKIAQDNKGNKIQAPLGIIYHVALVGFRITPLHLNSVSHCFCFSWVKV